MGELVAAGPSSGALALRGDQQEWTPQQQAALDQLGLAEATPGDLQVFQHVCQRTGLDPFSRQIYMIKRWDSLSGGNKWTIQTGIDGFRIIADRRAGLYGGQTDPQWCGEDGVWRDFWPGTRPPVAARVGVIRRDFDQPITAVAMFSEYAQTKKGGGLTHMWSDKPALMIAKCAEAAALRKAFPNDLAGLMTPEEMDRNDSPNGRVVARAEQVPVTARELTGGVVVPLPDEPPPDDEPPGEEAISKAQLAKLHIDLNEAGLTDRDRALRFYRLVTGRQVGSSKELTKREASQVIDHLDKRTNEDIAAMLDEGEDK